jgi:hypothetical protein
LYHSLDNDLGLLYYDETYDYPVAQHLNAPDILLLSYLGIFENIDRQDVKTPTKNFLQFEGNRPV